jgi:DNA-binding CsgD family transcriptional regulator
LPAINKLGQIKQEIKNAGALGLSMRLRLFFFLVVLVLTMVLGVIVIVLLNGILTTGLDAEEQLLKRELNRTSRNVREQYGLLSVQTVEFSKELSASIEKRLAEKKLEATDLQYYPEVLEDLIADEYERALFALQKSKSSGVFIILDATVNAKLKNAETSRAGLYIKNMEPNILSSFSPTVTLLRGFPSIGRNYSVPLHTQWKMEFDISDAPYYRLPMEQAVKQTLPISRLYFWSNLFTLPGTSEEVMLCSVPLVNSQGNVFGVCGFEISSMLFKLTHMPDNSTYSRMFSMFAPVSRDNFLTSGAMFSGGYSARNLLINSQLHCAKEDFGSLHRYQEEGGSSFVGFHLPVELYPKESAFLEQKWAVALLIPEEDIKNKLATFNLRLSLMFALLMMIGILISYFLSRRYIKPISKGLDILKSNDFTEAPKTKIPEIDDLIEFFSLRNEELQNSGEKEQSSDVLNDFVRNARTLSPAERSVFNLYAQQYTAKEIAAKLCLSINTIKTHTRRIYNKLNISSREELLVYIDMLKEAGKEFK